MNNHSASSVINHDNGTTLININDDCLRYIFQYLEIIDVANVALTCERLAFFANEAIFPKMAKQIQIAVVKDLPQPVLELSMRNLVQPFLSFGNHVKSLSLLGSIHDGRIRQKCLRIFKNFIKLCPNLEELRIEDMQFKKNDYKSLKGIKSNIKQFEIIHCDAITDEWTDLMRYLPNLEKFTLSGSNENTGDFFKHFKNLSSLSIESYSVMNLQTIFEFTGHCLQHLTLYFPAFEIDDFRSIGQLILTKLPKLERLEVLDFLKDNLTDLPHLKSLQLYCHVDSLNPILRNLSKYGIIEDLSICVCRCNFYDETNAPPLIFNQLQKFQFCSYTESGTEYLTDGKNELKLLHAMTKASMPRISTISFIFCELTFDKMHTIELLALLTSKKSLEVLIVFAEFQKPFLFVKQVIDILKTNTTVRPAFKLLMPNHALIGKEEEEASLQESY